jgi:hypothetical protein
MRRSGLTLIEMVVALLSSGVLVAGLAGALYLSTQAIPPIENITKKNTRAATVLYDLMSDIGMALSFSERTTKAITFTVPDRNGDNLVETIRYAWSGTAGDPLTYQYNGGPAINMAEDVRVFNLAALTRELHAETITAVIPTEIRMEEFIATKSLPATSNVTSLAVTKPTGAISGNLLIACVSLDGNALSSLSAPAGWTLIHKGPQGVSPIEQTFGVWYKIATATEPANYTFTWSPAEQAYAWIMRFSGHDATTPIHASAAQSGKAITAPSPAVMTSIPNTMIVRLGASDGITLPVQATSLLLHTYITNDRSSNTSSMACTGTAAYVMQPEAGSSGASSLIRTSIAGYTSVTIAIAPAPVQ